MWWIYVKPITLSIIWNTHQFCCNTAVQLVSLLFHVHEVLCSKFWLTCCFPNAGFFLVFLGLPGINQNNASNYANASFFHILPTLNTGFTSYHSALYSVIVISCWTHPLPWRKKQHFPSEIWYCTHIQEYRYLFPQN